MTSQNTVWFLKGLPGSGKTTFAKQYQAEHPKAVRVNKDDLRALLHNSVFSKGKEHFVLTVRDFIVDKALAEGHDCIVDDTNFAPKHLSRIEEIAAKHGASVEIKDFTDVPIDMCIQRDLQRPCSVGERVIRQMHRQFLETKPTLPAYNSSLRDCIIVDLDGTLALFDKNKVNPYDRDFSKDEVNSAIRDILWSMYDNAMYIFILSGRKDTFKEQTLKWLHNNNIRFACLYMREADDNRKDVIVKEELYNEYIKDKYNVIAVLDDRLSVCRLWYKLGLPLFRVGDPDADF